MNSAKEKRKKNKLTKDLDMDLFTKHLLRKMEKFYLVGITGRTSFILENLTGIKFKITIGNQIKCSCSNQSLYHCIHTLYVLTQIFYIPQDHPLLLQSKYTDKDLRYIIANRRIYSNRISDFLRFIKKKVPQENVILEEEDEDDMENLCAICHMQIVKSDPTTTCTNVCRNTFHLDCFSQWMKYELKSNGIVKCPLCRDVKGEEDLRVIKVKEYEIKQSINSKKVGICYNYYCDGCQLKEIEQNSAVYKCITCEDVTLCQGCFNSGKHIKHSFICKPANQKKWKECEDRKVKKKSDADQGFIRMKLPAYKRLYNFLACAYPSYFSKNNRWNVVECKKLDIKIQELECMMCKDPQKSFLRKLPCGHFIHHKCLRKRIEKGKLYCKHEGQKFLSGYESLLKQQELNKKVEFEINAELDKEEEEELQKSKEDYLDKSLSNSKTLKSLNNSHSTSCDSRRKKHRDRSKELRNKSLLNKFNSSMRVS